MSKVTVGTKRNLSSKILPVSEEKIFNWKIQQFRTKVSAIWYPERKKTSVPEEYIFECGEDIGLPTLWKMYLTRVDETVGFHMRLVNSPVEVNKVNAKFKYDWLQRTNEMPADPLEYRKGAQGKGWNDTFIDKDIIVGEECVRSNGHCEVKFHVIIFNDSLTEEERMGNKRMKFRFISMEEAFQDFGKLLDSEENADLTIQTTRDGKSLKAHRIILAARCPKFLEEMVKDQKTDGVGRISGLNVESLRSILKFIYTGTLGKGWEKGIQQIANAAKQYDIQLLFNFCDENMISVCRPRHAWTLLRCAQLLGLETAEKEIADYIERNFREVIRSEKFRFLRKRKNVKNLEELDSSSDKEES